MGDVLHIVQQQTINLISLYLLQNINTGDRAIDGSLNIVCTTFVTSILGAVFLLVRNRARAKHVWLECRIWLAWVAAAFMGTHTQPQEDVSAIADAALQFSPEMGSGIPAGGGAFIYRLELPSLAVFMSWFYTHHLDKDFSSKRLPTSITEFTEGSHMDMEAVLGAIAKGSGLKLDACLLPVWRSRDNKYVYVTGHGAAVGSQQLVLLADDHAAIVQCSAHVAAHEAKMTPLKGHGAHTRPVSAEDVKLMTFTGGQSVVVLSRVNTHKTFSRLFFRQKTQLLKVLTAFMHGTLYPKRLGMESKLGILLEGPPGTGKTAVVAAIANFLGRSLIVVDMQHLKTKTALSNLLNRNRSKVVFVFEEFDCMKCVQTRDSQEQEGRALSTEAFVGAILSSAATWHHQTRDPRDLTAEASSFGHSALTHNGPQSLPASDDLDLGYLLSKLDGLEDNEGLCIVATTNHPERIDPALLRPGRFGMHVVMSEADHDMMTNILAAAYDLTSDDDMLRLREQLQGVPEYVWTPSQLIQLSVELETQGECVVALSRATTAFHTRGCSGRAPRS
jgi:hypothetical protein